MFTFKFRCCEYNVIGTSGNTVLVRTICAPTRFCALHKKNRKNAKRINLLTQIDRHLAVGFFLKWRTLISAFVVIPSPTPRKVHFSPKPASSLYTCVCGSFTVTTSHPLAGVGVKLCRKLRPK